MSDDLSSAIRASVKIRGWVPVLMAAFSAGQAEGVEPDGAEDALALHGLVANDQVTEGVVAHVALVRRPRGVGVHAQRVELLPGVVVVDLVGALLGPVALPLRLHRVDVVGACHATRVGDASRALLSSVDGLVGEPAADLAANLVRVAADGREPAHRLLAWSSTTGGVAQLVERLTGSQEVRGFKSHRLHKIPAGEVASMSLDRACSHHGRHHVGVSPSPDAPTIECLCRSWDDTRPRA